MTLHDWLVIIMEDREPETIAALCDWLLEQGNEIDRELITEILIPRRKPVPYLQGHRHKGYKPILWVNPEYGKFGTKSSDSYRHYRQAAVPEPVFGRLPTEEIPQTKNYDTPEEAWAELLETLTGIRIRDAACHDHAGRA